MLLYPIRRDLGLGYEYCYNNDPASMHRNLKMRQNCKASDIVVENIRKEKDVQAALVEDVMIGVGPYELATPCKHLNVDAHVFVSVVKQATGPTPEKVPWGIACAKEGRCWLRLATPA